MKKQHPIPHNDYPADPELTALYTKWLALPPEKREQARLQIRACIRSHSGRRRSK